MKKSYCQLLEKIQVNHRTFTLNETDPQVGTKHSCAACYVPELDAIAIGEHKNPNIEERNAVITLTSMTPGLTCKIQLLQCGGLCDKYQTLDFLRAPKSKSTQWIHSPTKTKLFCAHAIDTSTCLR